MIRVVVVDDHSIVREGLRSLVEAQPGISVVGEAGARGLAATGSDLVDLGVQVIDQHAHGSWAHVVLLTGE